MRHPGQVLFSLHPTITVATVAAHLITESVMVVPHTGMVVTQSPPHSPHSDPMEVSQSPPHSSHMDK